jgi:ferredoxin like protein
MTTMANAPVPPKVEDKLYTNRYVVDSGRPHIKVKPHTTPSTALLAMTHVCPANCYAVNDRGQVEVAPDGCMECGTCRVLCAETDDIEWNYPRGGFGVLFKFG